MEQTDLTPAPRKIPVFEIINAACLRYGMPRSELIAQGRKQYVAHPRQRVMWLIDRLRPEISFTTMARVLGRVDHTTAIYGVDAVDARMEKSPDEIVEVAALCEALGVPFVGGKRRLRLTPEQVRARSLMGIKSAQMRVLRREQNGTDLRMAG